MHHDLFPKGARYEDIRDQVPSVFAPLRTLL